MARSRREHLFVVVVTAVLLVFILPVSATAALANVSHAYKVEGKINDGSLVSLDPNKPGYIEASNNGNAARLAGVVVDAKDSLLAVNPSSNTVQVATTGNVNVLVSTINGNISVGDQVAVSPFNGVGMKAESGSNVIGLAQTSLNSRTSEATPETVRNKQGKSSSVLVGYVSVTIDITTSNSNGAGVSKLDGLQKFVQNLTGHLVSTFRIIISFIVVSVTLLALIIVVYAAIYGSIISVGRNPLAKHAIYGTLRSVLFMTMIIAVVACATIYLLLS